LASRLYNSLSPSLLSLFHPPSTTQFSTLSLHDALPIYVSRLNKISFKIKAFGRYSKCRSLVDLVHHRLKYGLLKTAVLHNQAAVFRNISCNIFFGKFLSCGTV